MPRDYYEVLGVNRNASDTEIKKAGAETVMFMTWERPDSVQGGVTTANLSEMYYSLGQKLNASVAPVGLAFFRALLVRPQLILYNNDGHPTPQGTYLAACVIYGTIFRRNPMGNSYSGNLGDDKVAFLQKLRHNRWDIR